MKNKKLIMYLIIIFLILIIILFGINIYKKNKIKINQYIPEEEITNEQLRNTIITLYFGNNENNNIISETRKIDSKKLINNIYEELIKLLIEGPKNNNLIKLIPENTKINNIIISGDTLILDFSEEFIGEEIVGKIKEELIIKSIVYTVTELNEVNNVKILINGEDNKAFYDEEINFKNTFKKE